MRSIKRPAAALLALFLLMGVGMSIYSAEADSRKRQAKLRTDIRRYVEVIGPLAESGGGIVVTQARPRLADLHSGEVTAEQFALEARRWARDMGGIRKRFEGAPAPDELRDVKRLFDRSLAAYVEAFDGFAAAAGLSGDGRESALQESIRRAEDADAIYDSAMKLLAKVAKRAGLDPTTLGVG